MALDQRAFVREVRAHLKMTPTELGEALGKRNAYQAVNSWETTNAKNYRRLSYTDTMALLELAGWLNMQSDVSGLAAVSRGPLEAIAVGVARILENQEEGLQKIDALLQRPADHAQPPPGRAAPKR